jgi:hypothetical protein
LSCIGSTRPPRTAKAEESPLPPQRSLLRSPSGAESRIRTGEQPATCRASEAICGKRMDQACNGRRSHFRRASGCSFHPFRGPMRGSWPPTRRRRGWPAAPPIHRRGRELPP